MRAIYQDEGKVRMFLNYFDHLARESQSQVKLLHPVCYLSGLLVALVRDAEHLISASSP